MKKLLFGSAALVGVLMLGLTSCKKDETAPVITITGGNTQTVSLNAALTDPGATANDDSDGDVSSLVTSDYLEAVDKDQTGTYTVTYTVADKAGNTSTATKAVTVRNDAYMLEGNYAVTDVVNGSTSTYSETVRLSETVNNRILFNKFANYTGNSNIFANVTGNNLDVPSQSASIQGTATTFAGTGVKNATGFTIQYTETTSNTVQGVGNYVKQ